MGRSSLQENTIYFPINVVSALNLIYLLLLLVLWAKKHRLWPTSVRGDKGFLFASEGWGMGVGEFIINYAFRELNAWN